MPGLGVVGDSQQEVEQLIREAIAFHLDGLRRAGEPIPQLQPVRWLWHRNVLLLLRLLGRNVVLLENLIRLSQVGVRLVSVLVARKVVL